MGAQKAAAVFLKSEAAKLACLEDSLLLMDDCHCNLFLCLVASVI